MKTSQHYVFILKKFTSQHYFFLCKTSYVFLQEYYEIYSWYVIRKPSKIYEYTIQVAGEDMSTPFK